MHAAGPLRLFRRQAVALRHPFERLAIRGDLVDPDTVLELDVPSIAAGFGDDVYAVPPSCERVRDQLSPSRDAGFALTQIVAADKGDRQAVGRRGRRKGPEGGQMPRLPMAMRLLRAALRRGVPLRHTAL